MDNKEYKVKVEKLVFGGKALGRLPDGKVVFVTGDLLPDETGLVRILKKRKDFAEALLVKRFNDSSQRISALCPHYGTCGGCSLQSLNYEGQLTIKKTFVWESIFGLGKLDDVKIEPIACSKDQWRYRHKVELSFFCEDDGSVSLGFYHKDSWWKVVDIADCKLFDEKITDIMKTVRVWLKKNSLSAFHHRRLKGLLRNLILRKTHYTNEWMAGLVTTDEPFERNILDMLVNDLRKSVNLKSFYWRIVKARRQKKETCMDNLVWGEPYITEKFLGLKYQIQFPSFFQNNIPQAEKMVEFVIANLPDNKKGTGVISKALDLYCGGGTFSLPLAKKYSQSEILGVEIVSEAIDAAKQNARLNNIGNIKFIKADASRVIKELLEGTKYDVVIADPPRAGLDEKVRESLMNADIKRLFYVSCNPTTLGRDLKFLQDKYRIKQIKPFDLFPQTYHIECAAILDKRK